MEYNAKIITFQTRIQIEYVFILWETIILLTT